MKSHFIILSATLLLFTSCSKEEDVRPYCKTCYQHTTIYVNLDHLGETIDSGMVYLKNNASTAPNTYDDSAKINMWNGKYVAYFHNKDIGDYYVFAKGYSRIRWYNVSGGTAVKVTNDYKFTNISASIEGTR